MTATRFGSGFQVLMSPSTWGASTALKTVSAWIFLQYPENQPPSVELNFTTSDIMFGAWKFVTVVTDANGAVSSVYSGFQKVSITLSANKHTRAKKKDFLLLRLFISTKPLNIV